MARHNDRNTPAAMTSNKAAEAIQKTSTDSSSAIAREQNQMYSPPDSILSFFLQLFTFAINNKTGNVPETKSPIFPPPQAKTPH